MRKIRKLEPALPVLPVRKRVAGYARVSCEKESMLHSLSAQVSYYSELIQRRRDWEYVGVYADEAVTGTKIARPEFQRLMNDCRNGKVDMIVTKSVTRFARNTVLMLETVRELKTLNVDVWFEKDYIATAINPIKSRIYGCFFVFLSLVCRLNLQDATAEYPKKRKTKAFAVEHDGCFLADV